MLSDKYRELSSLAGTLGFQGFEMKEEGGKLKIKGNTTYQLEKDVFWDKIKTFSGWEQEVAADIRAERGDIHGMYTVKAGDTLSKIAKVHLDNASRYMDIFNANKDKLTDPNLIKVGQVLTIPKK